MLASLAPIAGAAVMWLVTGSSLVLWFALLGPLVAVAGLVDGRRTARRDLRIARADAERAREDARRTVADRHAAERAARESAHPDVAGFLAAPDEIWRPERPLAVTAGRGTARSDVRVVGDDELAAHAGGLEDAPLPVPLGEGICVVGPAPVAHAVARALVLQACLAVPPGRLRVVAGPGADRGWLDGLPHGAPASEGFGLGLAGPGDAPPPGTDAVIAVVPPGAPVPPWCAARLTVSAGARGVLDAAGVVSDVVLEGISRVQARELARMLAQRSERLRPAERDDAPVALGPLLGDRQGMRGSLRAPLGTDASGVVHVDLVADGPHALVVGVTGTGKSELLVSWVTALAAGASTRDVTFLLADFKGGTAFDGLRSLPHVTGVLTDLDGDGVPRAIESLRAELRRRERVIAAAGAREIDGCGDALARLVIVVDEFAALLTEHPELQRVFIDIAARGRALGMHLVLGTQRAGGVIRDALLTNCALRICLRVRDPPESRLLLGSDAAAQLPGGVAGRGRAFVRRAGDGAPHPVRIALASTKDVRLAGDRAAHDPVVSPVWLPALPSELTLAQLTTGDLDLDPDPDPGLRLALVDEPEQQRRSILTLRPADRGVTIVGGPGAGKSTALAVLAQQAAGPVVRVGPDPEAAWDAVHGLDARIARRALILVDDLDALGAAMPHEYEAALMSALDRVIRAAHAGGALVAVSVRRFAGPAARLADLLPLRVVLRTPSRMDHLAAGGDPGSFDPQSLPGRGSIGARRIQIPGMALLPDPPAPTPPTWHPGPGSSGLVVRSPDRSVTALSARGVEAVDLATLAPGTRTDAFARDGARVFVGDADHWQRQWALLAEVRATGELVVSSECAAHVRALTGSPELPPFARSGCGRGWSSDRGGALKRVQLT